MIAHTARILLLGIILLIGLADAVRAQSTDALYERAKAEGSVALYGAGPPEPFKRWIADFQTAISGRDGRVHRRLEQRTRPEDRAAARRPQDGGRRRHLPDHAGFRALEAAGRADAVQARRLRQDRSGLQGRGRCVHHGLGQSWSPTPTIRKAVSAADVPKSALDFLKPMFRGRLITTDPSDDDAGLMAFHAIVDKYGWDYMTKYMAQAPRFTRDGHAVVSNAVAAGDALATFDSTSTTPRLIAPASRSRWCCRRPIRRRCSWWPARSSGRAAPQRREVVPRLVSRARPAAPQRRLLGPLRRAAAARLQAAVGLQSRPQLPRAAFRRGAACGVETALRRLCEPPIDHGRRRGAPRGRPVPRPQSGGHKGLRTCVHDGRPSTQHWRHRVDTRRGRPRLGAFRGERRQALRDRVSGDPLNLIRVMPAKGRKLLPNPAPAASRPDRPNYRATPRSSQ